MFEKLCYAVGYVMIGVGIGISLMSIKEGFVKSSDKKRLIREKAKFEKAKAQIKAKADERVRRAHKHEAEAITVPMIVEAVKNSIRKKQEKK